MAVFKCQYITVPTVSKADAIVGMAKRLAQIFQNETPTNIGETKEEATKFTATEADKKAQIANNIPNK